MDNVTPRHYAVMDIEPLTFIIANGLGFCEGNIIKYVCRHPYKGDSLGDLKKARHYLDILITRRERKNALPS